jgi:hypothetical protein
MYPCTSQVPLQRQCHSVKSVQTTRTTCSCSAASANPRGLQAPASLRPISFTLWPRNELTQLGYSPRITNPSILAIERHHLHVLKPTTPLQSSPGPHCLSAEHASPCCLNALQLFLPMPAVPVSQYLPRPQSVLTLHWHLPSSSHEPLLHSASLIHRPPKLIAASVMHLPTGLPLQMAGDSHCSSREHAAP